MSPCNRNCADCQRVACRRRSVFSVTPQGARLSFWVSIVQQRPWYNGAGEPNFQTKKFEHEHGKISNEGPRDVEKLSLRSERKVSVLLVRRVHHTHATYDFTIYIRRCPIAASASHKHTCVGNAKFNQASVGILLLCPRLRLVRLVHFQNKNHIVSFLET